MCVDDIELGYYHTDTQNLVPNSTKKAIEPLLTVTVELMVKMLCGMLKLDMFNDSQLGKQCVSSK